MLSAADSLHDDSFFVFDGQSEELYYFAYGSNMNAAQMRQRCRKPEVVGIARLDGHRIAFFGHSRIWDSGQETVVPDPGQAVWGVLYELSSQDMDRLDAWQGVRMDGAGPYFHYPVRVKGADGRTYAALLYKKDVLGEPRAPSKPYLDLIIAGAEEKGLLADYIGALRKIESKPASYPVPGPRAYDPGSLLAWDCSTCSA